MRKPSYSKLLNSILKYKFIILLIALLITVTMGFIASKISLDLGMYTLLPDEDDDVKAFKEISSNFGGFDNIIIVLESQKDENKEKAAEDIAASMTEITDVVRAVDYKLPYEFIKDNFLLYMDKEDFNEIMNVFSGNPVLLSIFQAENNLAAFFELISSGEEIKLNDNILKIFEKIPMDKKITEETLLTDFYKGLDNETIERLKNEYYYSDDKSKLLIFLRPTNSDHDMLFFEKMVSEVEAKMNQIMVNYPDVSYEITGMAKMMEEQQNHLNKRITIVSIAALFLILMLFIVAYRRILAPILAMVPIIIALIWVLGITQLIIGRLNLVTSIFAVILLGLSIDFSIHFITKFYYEKEQGNNSYESLVKVFNHTMPGIVTGAITTAVAFYTLMISDFKGLSELGFVAGTGILMSLISVMILLPVFISLFDKRLKVTKEVNKKTRSRYSEFLLKRKGLIFAAVILLILITYIPGIRLEFNYNAFDLIPKLPSVVVKDQLSEEFDNSFEYSILKAENIEQARRQYEEVIKKDFYSVIDSPINYIPQDNQQEKIKKIKEIYDSFNNNRYKITEPSLSLDMQFYRMMNILAQVEQNPTMLPQGMSLEDYKTIKKLLMNISDMNNEELEILSDNLKLISNQLIEGLGAALTTGEITINKLPEVIKSKYLGKDGSLGTYVFFKRNMWDEEPLKKMATELRSIDKNVSGTNFMALKLVDYIRSDLIKSSIAVFIALLVIVYLDFRRIRIVLVTITPVVLGFIWLLGYMSLFSIKFSVANIVAFPLIIGIGIDNGIHMMHSYIANRSRDIKYMMLQSGKAVLVTSLTSMIGFGLLYFVKDPLVSELGIMLLIGVFFCLIISITILPILLSKFGKYLFDWNEE